MPRDGSSTRCAAFLPASSARNSASIWYRRQPKADASIASPIARRQVQCKTMRRSGLAAHTAMKRSLEDEIAHLRDLDRRGLHARWKGVFRRQPPLHLPRHLLFAVLAYRLQADALGDLSPDTVRLLKQIGSNGSTVDAARLASQFDRRRINLKPGTILTREWNGQCHRVMVVDQGFVWNGKAYDSLSRIAFAITGSKWNGPRFFGLRDKAAVETNP